ncbi:MAG: RNA polymerase sigma factor [Planctomycetaceae bacterium]
MRPQQTLQQESLDVTAESSRCDAKLIDAARRGAEDAFRSLVQKYERRLRSVVQRFVHDADQVDDLMQETFLRVYQSLHQFDTSRRFAPWLFQVGVNITLDFLRRKKRRIWGRLFSQGTSETDYDPPQADPNVQQDLQQEVRAVLQQVPEKFRTVVILRDLENFSTSEIATILKRKEATIRWRLAEGRLHFQHLWTQRQHDS